eukprot:6625476-Pyramimonas_sp.AAC.1
MPKGPLCCALLLAHARSRHGLRDREQALGARAVRGASTARPLSPSSSFLLFILVLLALLIS